MNTLKKYLGLLWMALAPLLVFFLVKTALAEISSKPLLDTWIQWGVFILIFIPIAFGLALFGYFAFRDEYNQDPGAGSE